jgi:hypothetical protein
MKFLSYKVGYRHRIHHHRRGAGGWAAGPGGAASTGGGSCWAPALRGAGGRATDHGGTASTGGGSRWDGELHRLTWGGRRLQQADVDTLLAYGSFFASAESVAGGLHHHLPLHPRSLRSPRQRLDHARALPHRYPTCSSLLPLAPQMSFNRR